MSTVINTTPAEKKGWQTLIGRILAARDTERAYRARLISGRAEHTEAQAYMDILPYAENQWQVPAVIQAAAIAAEFTDIPHEKNVRLGHSFRRVLDAKKHKDLSEPHLITTALEGLIHQDDIRQVGDTLRRLLAYGRKTEVGFDFYQIARTLLYWGDGTTETSIRGRNQILRDVYLAPNK